MTPRLRERSTRRRPPWQGELFAVAFLLLGYDRVANLAQLRVRAADAHAWRLLRLEADLHLAVERSLVAAVAPHQRLGQVLAVYYDLAHGLTTVGVLVGVYLLRPTTYRRARRALVGANLFALGVFLLLPVTPPRLLAGSGVLDIVARSGTWGSWSTASSVAQHADQYGALPSLHVAWSTWTLRAVRSATDRRLARAVAAAHLVLTVAVVLLTGNHYIIDVAAGGLTAALAWTLAGSGAAAPVTVVDRLVSR